MAKRYYPLDANTLFGEDVTMTATGNVQKGGVDAVFKIGKGRQDMSLVVDISAYDATTGDEGYTFLLQGSNAEDFSDDIENLAALEIGPAAVRTGGARTSPIGRYGIPVSNDLIDEFTYVRLRLIAAGTTPSITFTAWLSERP
ncbi:hypothetical protein [Chelatococcus sp. XZ-Ab1]|uniref:hypothetical protein n=1 Tax=Chelatococcus sp. XZ-Ab1 TaxID=3034027 RepID=UPI0023E3644D|nr:hypothetical protein [Chelatococcus sp. XZ-Ab1]